MSNKINTERYILVAVPICIAISVLLTSLVSFFIKKDFIHNLKRIEFIVDSNTAFKAELYYTYDTAFNPSQKLISIKSSKDTIVFEIPKGTDVIKKFRLDLGNDSLLHFVKIKAMNLIFVKKRIHLIEEEVFKNIFINSASVNLNKAQRIIEIKGDTAPYDPYIVFSPLGEIAKSGSQYSIALLFPFAILLLVLFIKYRKFKMDVLEILMLLFIICIPLKIAWTTFCTLLLCVYGIVKTFQNGKMRVINIVYQVFITLFCGLILLGRPYAVSSIDKYLALVLFGIISLTVSIPRYKIYRQYVYFILIFNAIIVASGISFLLWLSEFYALGIVDYFEEIKTYSGNIRDWLFYDHAAFLSFFGLVGMLFVQTLCQENRLGKYFSFLYHILLLLFIILVGARISLLIYLIFLLNFIIKLNWKKRILINSLLFITFAYSLVKNIEKIDPNRYYLWSVSWEAIKEKPFLGYGLGKSNEILHNKRFIPQADFIQDLELNHSHNQFITFFLEIGILGVLTLMIILFYFLYKSKMYRNEPLILFIFGLGYIFFTESILETSKPIYVICFLFLLLTACSNLKVEPSVKISAQP